MLNKNKFIAHFALAGAVFGLPSGAFAQSSVTSYGQSGGITAGTVNMSGVPPQTSSVPNAICNVRTYNQTGGETAEAVTILPNGRVVRDQSVCDGTRPTAKHRVAHRTPR